MKFFARKHRSFALLSVIATIIVAVVLFGFISAASIRTDQTNEQTLKADVSSLSKAIAFAEENGGISIGETSILISETVEGSDVLVTPASHGFRVFGYSGSHSVCSSVYRGVVSRLAPCPAPSGDSCSAGGLDAYTVGYFEALKASHRVGVTGKSIRELSMRSYYEHDFSYPFSWSSCSRSYEQGWADFLVGLEPND